MNSSEESPEESKFVQLRVAVQDLLCELRIDGVCLEVMARGYSPDYPGAVGTYKDGVWKNPSCKMQLSRVVAQKLIDGGVIDYWSGKDPVGDDTMQGVREVADLLLCLPGDRFGEIMNECRLHQGAMLPYEQHELRRAMEKLSKIIKCGRDESKYETGAESSNSMGTGLPDKNDGQ